MYRIGRRSKKKTKRKLWLGILALLIIVFAGAAFFIVKLLQEEDTTITTPLAITREYAAPDANENKVFELDGFNLKLPNDWVLKDHSTGGRYNLYSWQATKKNADNRWLEVYVDRVPEDKAFNRLLPVSVDNNKIIPTGSVSDNCTAFTGTQGANKPANPGVDKLPAKWQGVEFMCDMANYTRNVVGVGSPGSQGRLVLSGPTTGQHTFFFVYIDHNINPDYQILEEALTSLTVK